MSPTTPTEDHEHGEDRERQRFVPILPPPELPVPPARDYQQPPSELQDPDATIVGLPSDATVVAGPLQDPEQDEGLVADLLGEPETEAMPQAPPATSAWTMPQAVLDQDSPQELVPDAAGLPAAESAGFLPWSGNDEEAAAAAAAAAETPEIIPERPAAAPAASEQLAPAPAAAHGADDRAATTASAGGAAASGPGFLSRELAVGPLRLHGAWWLALVAVLLVLVLLIVLIVNVTARGGDDAAGPAPTESASGSASATTSPGAQLPSGVRQAIADGAYVGAGGPAPANVTQASSVLDGDVAVVVTPSGNIGCDLAAQDAGCGVKSSRTGKTSHWWVPLGGADARALGARAQDPAWIRAGKKAQTLPYGSSVQHGDLVCASEQNGLTCWDLKTGHGTFLSRSTQVTF